MRRTANVDLAAFHKIDARGAGLDAHVTPAAQDGLRLAVDDLDTHWSSDADGFAVDDPHGVGSRFVGARSGCGDQRSPKDGHARDRYYAAAPPCEQAEENPTPFTTPPPYPNILPSPTHPPPHPRPD